MEQAVAAHGAARNAFAQHEPVTFERRLRPVRATASPGVDARRPAVRPATMSPSSTSGSNTPGSGRVDEVVGAADGQDAGFGRGGAVRPRRGCLHVDEKVAQPAFRDCAAPPASPFRSRRVPCRCTMTPLRSARTGERLIAALALRELGDVGERRAECLQRGHRLLELRGIRANASSASVGTYISDDPPECRSHTRSASGIELVLDVIGDLLRDGAVRVAREDAVEVQARRWARPAARPSRRESSPSESRMTRPAIISGFSHCASLQSRDLALYSSP